MAQKSHKLTEERLIYCSGPNWEGDGSKATSPCKFSMSMTTFAKRFKCSYCCVGMSPDSIYADRHRVIRNPQEEVMTSKKAPESKQDTPVETNPLENAMQKKIAKEPTVGESLADATLPVADEAAEEATLVLKDATEAVKEPKKLAGKKRRRRRF